MKPREESDPAEGGRETVEEALEHLVVEIREIRSTVRQLPAEEAENPPSAKDSEGRPLRPAA